MNHKRILLIEDDPALREASAAILADAGHAVIPVSCGEADLVHMFDPDPPDLVILDLLLPAMSGFEFLKVRRRVPRLREIPVLVTSAYCDPHAIVGLEHGLAALKKPFTLEALLAQVEAIREGMKDEGGRMKGNRP